MPAKAHELAQVALIRATRARVVGVGEPGDRQRHLGQLLELDGREVARWDGLGCSQGQLRRQLKNTFIKIWTCRSRRIGIAPPDKGR